MALSPGGYVPGRTSTLFRLADAECLLNRQGQCVRDDSAHLRDGSFVVQAGDGSVAARFYGECLHRPCHVVSVESVVDGKPLARLCLICDAQLEA